MRSSDVWMGLPYDMFSFTCMSYMIAETVNAVLGNCSITAGSSHIYSKDYAGAEDVLYSPRFGVTMLDLGIGNDLWPILRGAADAESQNEALESLLNWRPVYAKTR
jgi:Thymidylate synthase